MENIIKPFGDFVRNVVLPQNPGYKTWQNVEEKLVNLQTEFENSFGNLNPFEIDLANRDAFINRIRECLKTRGETPFEVFNIAENNGIPHAMLNTHLFKFVEYYNNPILFSSWQELVDLINNRLGQKFCREFQEQRIKLNGNSRVASNDRIFGIARNDWTINIGSESELQYHMFFKENNLGYGLGFNAQKTINNLAPLDNVQPFINSFFKHYNEIISILKGYRYLHSDEETLQNMKIGDFVCFGKTIPYEELQKDHFKIDGIKFLEMLYDLQENQYKAYKLIFGNRYILTGMKANATDIISLLKYKKQIILQGPPGTGKTRLAKQIAQELSRPKAITKEDIKDTLKVGAIVTSTYDKIAYTVVDINETGTTLQLANSNKRTVNHDSTILAYANYIASKPLIGGDAYQAAIAKYIYSNQVDKTSIELVQFHPSYSYEDFVRGIVSKPNIDGDGIVYES